MLVATRAVARSTRKRTRVGRAEEAAVMRSAAALGDAKCVERFPRGHPTLQGGADLVLALDLVPGPADDGLLGSPRHDHDAVLVGDDEVARVEADATDLDGDVHVADPLAVLAVGG